MQINLKKLVKQLESWAQPTAKPASKVGSNGVIAPKPTKPIDVFSATPVLKPFGIPTPNAMPGLPAPQYDAKTADAVLTSLYQGVLGRNPDPSGQSAYTPMLQAGKLSVVVNALLTSAEFQNHTKGMAPSQLSEDLYQAILGRAPDAGGNLATIDAISSGNTALRVFDMVTSAENKDRLANLSSAPQPPVINNPAPTNPTPTNPTPSTTIPPDGVDLSTAIVHNSPQDVANWPVTAKITGLQLAPDGVHVDFTKKDGPDSWPDVPFGAPGDSLQYTIWMVEKINGQWQTSGGIEYWRGLDKNGGPPDQFAQNWYYAPDRWGDMSTHQPQPGEEVGFFVTAGDARNNGNTLVKERSNIVTIPFPDKNGGSYSF